MQPVDAEQFKPGDCADYIDQGVHRRKFVEVSRRPAMRGGLGVLQRVKDSPGGLLRGFRQTGLPDGRVEICKAAGSPAVLVEIHVKQGGVERAALYPFG